MEKPSPGPAQLADHQFEQALAALGADSASREEKIQMLMEIAMGLQQKPKSVKQLHDAVALYDRAIELCHADEALEVARLTARKATALHAIPTDDPALLLTAQFCLESAIPVLAREGSAEESAEAHMDLGLVLQTLAGFNRARIGDAIAAYQVALRTFSRGAHPAEYAILHNNLATAFLSMPATDERSKMREALAVQSFEAALEVVTLVDQPAEYAMLQNNLGNALQYASSSHVVENNLRALDAYDEALRVRTAADTPLEYANTISNKANCLRNLPDDPTQPDAGNRKRLLAAKALYEEARQIFAAHREDGKAEAMSEVLDGIGEELGNGKPQEFGVDLISRSTMNGSREN